MHISSWVRLAVAGFILLISGQSDAQEAVEADNCATSTWGVANETQTGIMLKYDVINGCDYAVTARLNYAWECNVNGDVYNETREDYLGCTVPPRGEQTCQVSPECMFVTQRAWINLVTLQRIQTGGEGAQPPPTDQVLDLSDGATAGGGGGDPPAPAWNFLHHQDGVEFLSRWDDPNPDDPAAKQNLFLRAVNNNDHRVAIDLVVIFTAGGQDDAPCKARFEIDSGGAVEGGQAGLVCVPFGAEPGIARAAWRVEGLTIRDPDAVAEVPAGSGHEGSDPDASTDGSADSSDDRPRAVDRDKADAAYERRTEVIYEIKESALDGIRDFAVLLREQNIDSLLDDVVTHMERNIQELREYGDTPCSICDGLGYVKCQHCDRGTNACRLCDHGTKMCDVCRGTGEVAEGYTCVNCGGSGEVKCDHCLGTGRTVCRECGGTTWVRCSHCAGTGREE